MSKRLVKNRKLTNRQRNQLVKYFALEMPASRAARAMNINRHTAQRIYQVIRRCLAKECELESPFGGEVECDESYFGGRRKGPRGRGAAGKVPVFGLLRRRGISDVLHGFSLLGAASFIKPLDNREDQNRNHPCLNLGTVLRLPISGLDGILFGVAV